MSATCAAIEPHARRPVAIEPEHGRNRREIDASQLRARRRLIRRHCRTLLALPLL